MDTKEFMKKFFAGVFFLIGLGLIFMVIFTIGKEKGFTQPKFQVEVLFGDVGGLIEGAPVRLAGVNVGTVASINFLEEEFRNRYVKVGLNVFNKYRRQLDQNVQFVIRTEGILGEKLVEINVIDGGQKVDLSRPIIGQDLLEVQDLAEVFQEAVQSFTKTSEGFNEVDIKGLSKALSETAESLSTTSKGVSEILTEMNYISIKSKRLLDRLEQGIIDRDLFKVF